MFFASVWVSVLPFPPAHARESHDLVFAFRVFGWRSVRSSDSSVPRDPEYVLEVVQ
jgi:hypothetical protein